MNKSSTLPIQDKLFCLKKDITKLSRAIAENYSFEYSKARILALNLMSFENSYEFDRWYEKETALVNSAVKSTRRLNCKCETNPKNDEPVYIFGCEPSYILWDRKTGETFTIDELTEVVNEDGLKHNFVIQRKAICFDSICNIWKGDRDQESEYRAADCSCKKSFAFYVASSANKPLYQLSKVEDVVSWSSIWGGIAFFNESLMDSIKERETELAAKLMNRYAVQKFNSISTEQLIPTI
jgi:hypothetical protein